MANQSDLIKVYEEHRLNIISRLVTQHGVLQDDAEDSLQDVMLKTLENWRAYSSTLKNWSQDDLAGYLFVAARNQCRNVFTQNSRRRNREQSWKESS